MNFLDFLSETSQNKTIVFAFGRFQPPTIGHGLLIKKVIDLAKSLRADHVIYASKTQDSKKNPLSVKQKVFYLRRMFPNAKFSPAEDNTRTFIEVLKFFDKTGYKNVVMVAGSDRILEYQKLIDRYNGKDFNFTSVKVVSAGERDPDADGAAGMSGTKMREAAIKNDFESFRTGIPSTLSDKETKSLMNAIRLSMNIREFVDWDINNKFNFLVSEGVHDKGIFKAVFLAGAPGSGKDYVLNNTLAGHGLTEINSDNALEYMMDRDNLDMKMPDSEEEARNLIRGRAKNITDLKERLAIYGRNGLIINGTGDDHNKIAKIKKRLEELGYETSMVCVLTSDEVSKQRNIDRGQRGGRTVPEKIRKSKWDGVQESRPEYAKLFRNNYIEYDNSDDLRVASPEIKDAKQEEQMQIFKKIREFTQKPVKNEKATSWIATELNKKENLVVPQKQSELSVNTNSSAYEEAMKMGLQYYGFGRYGTDGKVTYHSVHDKLVKVGQYKQPEKSSDIKYTPSMQYGTKQKEKFEKAKQSSKLPKDIKKEDVDTELEMFLTEAVTFTIQADTPEELKKTLHLIKSEDEEEKVEEQKSLTDFSAFNLLTLGTGIIKEEMEKCKYILDRFGKPRKFILRKEAAKEAHTKKGEVVKVPNGYYVKLTENEDVINTEKFIQEETTCNTRTTIGRNTNSKKESIIKTENYQNKEKINEIDFGTEVGMPLAGYNKEKIDRKTGKAVTELTGDETGASIGDQKTDELQKQGISLQTFKTKRGNF